MASERFQPSGPLRGTLTAPPDKSISHRAALLAAMSGEPVVVERYLCSADTDSSLGAVEAVGARVSRGARRGAGRRVEIEGVGLRGARAPAEPIDVGNAGTLIRLMSGWLAGQPPDTGEFVLDGDASIRRRPMERVAAPLREMGAEVRTADGGTPPLAISGRRLSGIEYRMPVASAQVKSCLLLAGLLAEGGTTVIEPAESRDHTERMLAASGAEIQASGRASLPGRPVPRRIELRPGRALQLPSLAIPGDLSSAAFHLAAALLVPGSEVRVEGVGLNPTRVGLLGILNRLGALIEVEETGYEAGEPIGRLTARHGPLSGTSVLEAEVPLAIDELPLVALLGCFAEGRTRITGAGELRHKESDRIAGVVDGLRGLGAEVEALPDGLVVQGTGGLRGGGIDSRGDHRLAMLGAVAGLACETGVEVEGFEAAAVSYPGFESDLRALLER
jgi:3-phosphoshikimate 1-carboxyvinyltransferase